MYRWGYRDWSKRPSEGQLHEARKKTLIGPGLLRRRQSVSLHAWHHQGPRKPSSCAPFTLNSRWGRAATGKKKKKKVLHLCIRGHFGHVQLFVILWTVACQASLSGRRFSRQDCCSVLANTGCHTLLELYISCRPSRQAPEYLVLPEPLQPKHCPTSTPGPQGPTQVLQGSLRSKPQGTTHMRGGNKTTAETQGPCG